WYGFARITRHLADLDFCLALKRAGCVMLQLGLESGDQGILDQLEKGVDLEVASQALRALKRAGIATYVYLLFGTPAETVEEARKTLAFVADRHDQIGYLNVAIFNLPLGGLEGQELATEEFSEGDLSLYTNFSHPRGWHRNLVRQFLDKEFKRHPAIAPILRREPPIFTSNHAPFFTL
ncbi:MAG: radical SAM protein, partial [Deltaproteobacteria bacterium]|nr:radical SAM protein [Deltaproteobacteria bacterium]